MLLKSCCSFDKYWMMLNHAVNTLLSSQPWTCSEIHIDSCSVCVSMPAEYCYLTFEMLVEWWWLMNIYLPCCCLCWKHENTWYMLLLHMPCSCWNLNHFPMPYCLCGLVESFCFDDWWQHEYVPAAVMMMLFCCYAWTQETVCFENMIP
jgi:hypothetical protein